MGNAGAREEYALTASDKVTTVLLIYTVKSGKSICNDRGKKIYQKNKISIIMMSVTTSAYNATSSSSSH
jgi:hypothetical protein